MKNKTGAEKFREIRDRQLRQRRKRTASITPPEGVPISFQVSGLGGRFGAQLADILLTLTLTIGLMIIAWQSNWVSGTGLEILGALLFFFLRVPYYIAAEIIMNGQTLGKRLLGLRVISADGRTLSAYAITVRNLMKEMEIFAPGGFLLVAPQLDGLTIILLLVWIAILLAVPLFNRKRQRLGDLIANTLVIRLPRPQLLPDIAQQTVPTDRFVFLPHHLDHYGKFELQTLEQILQVRTENLNAAARGQHEANLARVRDAIISRTGYEMTVSPEETEAFLRHFYRTQRAYLENRKLYGDAREDKYHRNDLLSEKTTPPGWRPL